jgi:transcriptional regulator with GAF, ATPase, and Fis domain
MIMVDHRVVQGKDVPLEPGRIPEFTDIITVDPHLTDILFRLPIYADSDLPILLTGEPGTGKELVAMAIFSLGPAWRRSCQRLNCAALTESLASSELFGHLRGAFTGADHARPGKFRLAHGGSLFLDEVGELPLSIQPKLLRAVEQLGLDGQGQLPHFIQEEAPSMSQPEFARPGVPGVGKGPPDVPEQLARGQRLR